MPARAELAEDLSVALLLALERLSPLERAAFLLHDVFDMDYAAVARGARAQRGRVPPARRPRPRARAARRARASSRPTSRPSKLVDAFAAALATGDVTTLAALLAEDAVFYSDGGGKRQRRAQPDLRSRQDPAVRRSAIDAQARAADRRSSASRINGLPGFVAAHDRRPRDDRVRDRTRGLITAIYGDPQPGQARAPQSIVTP